MNKIKYEKFTIHSSPIPACKAPFHFWQTPKQLAENVFGHHLVHLKLQKTNFNLYLNYFDFLYF